MVWVVCVLLQTCSSAVPLAVLVAVQVCVLAVNCACHTSPWPVVEADNVLVPAAVLLLAGVV